jgi:predicted nucleic acid-binding protein
MSDMFDSMVLINAIKAPTLAPAGVDDVLQRSSQLVAQAEQILVSAISWYEIRRFVPPEQEKHLAELEKRIQVVRTDAAVVEFANTLSKKVQQTLGVTPDVCSRCGLPPGQRSGTGCNRAVALKSRFADFLIAATAHVRADVDRLYTFDTGVLNMQEFLRPRVIEPPSIYGPLFEHHTGKVESAPTGTTKAAKRK